MKMEYINNKLFTFLENLKNNYLTINKNVNIETKRKIFYISDSDDSINSY